jgi:hypothetical protein
LKNSGGTGVWHESYFMQGGMEAVYGDMPIDVGFLSFAPQHEARGAMYSARSRAKQKAQRDTSAPVDENELYDASPVLKR